MSRGGRGSRSWRRTARTARSVSSTYCREAEGVDTSRPWRRALFVVLGGAGLFGLNFGPFDAVLFPMVIVGPLLTGLVMELRRWPWVLGAAAWAVMGVISLVYDWVLHDEDQAFHVALTIWMFLLAALGAMAVRLTRRLRPSSGDR